MIIKRDINFGGPPQFDEGNKENTQASSLLARIPTPAIIGAVAGFLAFVIVGLVMYRRRESNRLSLTAERQKRNTIQRQQDQENSQHDPIAEMTAVGIHLPNNRMNLEPLFGTTTKKSNKPKIITVGGGKSPFKKLSIAPTDDNVLGSPIKAVVIPRRTLSISIENPGGGDARRRSNLMASAVAAAASASKSSRGKISSLPPPPHAANSNGAPMTTTPAKTLNSILESMAFNGIPETEEPASMNPRESMVSNASSISSIESDDMEMETKYEVVEHWMPQRFDELELIPGDVVIVYQIFEDGWCDGKIEGTEDTGAFPFACLKGSSWSLGNIAADEPQLEDVGESIQELDLQDESTNGTIHYEFRKSEASIGTDSYNTGSSSGRSSEYDKSTTNTSSQSGSQQGSNLSLAMQKQEKAKSRFSGILKNIDQYVEEFEPK
ncbi:hypothetical protein BDR26DRAFT_1007423 [Obelidium mucronatum]|nr:hypothetical protein BDR26DRAFT_1007423 [Obelidium mucronatum]